jgi:hypothetical protein
LRRSGGIERGIVCHGIGSFSVLVNGYPTEQVNIERDLKQGDSLAPFLYLLVAEGFSSLMSKTVRWGTLKVSRSGRIVR